MGNLITSPEARQRPQITHVIFDLDGTLIDSEAQCIKLQADCLAKYGKTFDAKDNRSLRGLTSDEGVKAIIKMYGLPITHQEYAALYESKYAQFLNDCEPLPGADRLIQHLFRYRIPMAICTNSTQAHLDIKTKKFAAWMGMIPLKVIAASDPEIKNPKPSPEPFQVTMNRFAVKPQSPKNVLIFEDSLIGAIAGIESGAHVVLIPQSMDPETRKQIEILRPRLAAVLKSLEDFHPEKFNLPALN